jgi:hypothetical protein
MAARSSTETEYRGLATTIVVVVWFHDLFSRLSILLPTPVLWCDNLGAIFLASNPAFHARTKYIELDYHFVREKMTTGSIQVRFICSQDQIADTLTKSLSTNRFVFLRPKLIVSCPTVLLRGLLIVISITMPKEKITCITMS